MRSNKPYKGLDDVGRIAYIFAIVWKNLRLSEKSLGRFALCHA